MMCKKPFTGVECRNAHPVIVAIFNTWEGSHRLLSATRAVGYFMGVQSILGALMLQLYHIAVCNQAQ